MCFHNIPQGRVIVSLLGTHAEWMSYCWNLEDPHNAGTVGCIAALAAGCCLNFIPLDMVDCASLRFRNNMAWSSVHMVCWPRNICSYKKTAVYRYTGTIQEKSNSIATPIPSPHVLRKVILPPLFITNIAQCLWSERGSVVVKLISQRLLCIHGQNWHWLKQRCW